MKHLYLACMCIMGFFAVQAQQPVITNIAPMRTYPLDTVLITGSGFDVPASVQVWFDHVKGRVVSASEFSILVAVPAQARYHNVEVINLTTRLSAKSPLKFLSSFSGTSFDPAKFQSVDLSTNSPSVFDLCSADLDGDGKPDLIGTRNDGGTDLVVLHNKSAVGAVSYTKYDKSNLPVLNLTQPTQHIACGDLNMDGKPDVVASRAGPTANSIFVFRNTSGAAPGFAGAIELFLDIGNLARQVAIHDLNGDGKPEIIVANSANTSNLYVFVNQSAGGALSINPTPLKFSVAGAPNTLALELQDFDNDGKTDIMASQNQGANLFFLKNTSTASVNFAAAQTISVVGTINDIGSADFNHDGKLDLVVTSVFGGQVFLLLNQTSGGTVSFSSQIPAATGTGPFGVECADINGDGFADIVVHNRQVSYISVFLHNGNSTSPTFTSSTIATPSKQGWFSRVADFDGDAKPDIVFTSAVGIGASNTITMLRNQNCHKPVILNEPPLAICPGQTIRLKSIPIPNVTFEWIKDGATVKPAGIDPFVYITSAGSYTVKATGEGGACAVTSAPLVVGSGTGAVPADAAIAPIAQACAGGNLTITANAVPGATYSWQGPNGFAVEETDNQLVISSVTPAQAGIYSLRLKMGGCTGDEDAEEAIVADVGSFTISSSNPSQTLCEGENLTLSVGSAPGRSYQWIKDGADVGGQTTTTLMLTNAAPASAGSYQTRITFGGCSEETSPTTVVIRKKPVANFTVGTACMNEEIAFTNTSTVDGLPGVAYTWSFGDGGTSTDFSPTHPYADSPAQDPSLTVNYTGLPTCTSTISKAITVLAPEAPEIIASAPDICPGKTVTLSLTAMYTSIEWFSGSASIGTSPTVDITEPGSYAVAVQNTNGCAGRSDVVIDRSADCSTVVIVVPNMFSPNGDAQNDRWEIRGIDSVPDCTMKVFDDRGVKLWDKNGYDINGWDGTYNGKALPDGVYFYILTCPDRKPMTGSVLIVK
ncbi:FG-GAP-like repeat-containing protein [Dawidia soli]|uniref:VCBS repeat-containing protein n=1 Tax=Dawidia soli TaxID=2782352 RepID=A0AAP2DBS6_9BACT|nr:FG-GAP-like repeat-containing protein [Dawidia soli]MBT1689131.1 VCBS repeat-containing protein [Dawidia soli]